MQKSELRLERRLLCADVVHVSWPASDGVRTIEALLEDISPLGACVQIEEQLPLNIEITLTAEGKNLSGLISYCVYRDYGYFVGIRFLRTHWSSGVFLPRHLTDLQTLIDRCSD
jgi:hypothetical protein